MIPQLYDISRGRKTSSIIALVCGIWLFISPWIFKADSMGNAYSSWIVGALIAIMAAFELSSPTMVGLLSWISCLLAIWTFASPWIFGYTNSTGRFITSLCVGVIVFIAAIGNAMNPPHPSHPVATTH